MAMAICHKSHMGGKTEASFWLSSNSSPMPSSSTNEDNASSLTQKHTHSCKTKRQTLLISRVLLSLFRFICSTCQVQQTDDKRTKERTIEWRTNRQHATSTTLLPTHTPTSTPISSCAVVPHFCALFFFLRFFDFHVWLTAVAPISLAICFVSGRYMRIH